MSTIEVRTAKPYQVHIVPGALERLPELLGDATRTAIIHPAVLSDQAHLIAQQVPQPLLLEVPAAEEAKTAATLMSCWDALAAAGFTRNDLVIGVGGGATTDLAGFVAATWLRGIDFISVPTTVLGMVDAAVGGKTGINIAAGKNLVGAFHEPRAVLCDLDLLLSLPEVDVRAGLGEVIKCGFIADPRILELVSQDPEDAVNPASLRFAELVRRAVAVKAETVAGDLFEATSTGTRVGREALNYGHTLGHAIEKVHQFEWRHGEAISVGMVFAAELSRRALGLDPTVVDQQRESLASVQLPTTYQGDWAPLRAAMSLDKKTRGNTLRFVGLPEVGRVSIIDAPDEALLEECFAALTPPA
ncbi:3-dehydroquinate synthase [Tessaracoccus sp. SD287]|uniref:3-dehydroquinate synthase n=1 Tax=Tessaracoccus sp. SD287 TaxID=2782008 RepID=UPI001A95D103|nr:3-dehydroquinate synthase [Tessaracoccus sp. SD287]